MHQYRLSIEEGISLARGFGNGAYGRIFKVEQLARQVLEPRHGDFRVIREDSREGEGEVYEAKGTHLGCVRWGL